MAVGPRLLSESEAVSGRGARVAAARRLAACEENWE